MTILLYDQNCALCRLLAKLVATDLPKTWRLEAWQVYTGIPEKPQENEQTPGFPLELCLLNEQGVWLQGEAAWEYLIKSLPQLQAYQTLAHRIGLAPPVSARWLRRFAHGLRRFCGRCRAPRKLSSPTHSKT